MHDSSRARPAMPCGISAEIEEARPCLCWQRLLLQSRTSYRSGNVALVAQTAATGLERVSSAAFNEPRRRDLDLAGGSAAAGSGRGRGGVSQAVVGQARRLRACE